MEQGAVSVHSSPVSADSPLLVRFNAGNQGAWRITQILEVVGEPLAWAERLDIHEGTGPDRCDERLWQLRGVTSHQRYTTSAEWRSLRARQPPLHRPEATCARLIPIRKSAAWWRLSQDERREIYEERSRHTSIGLEYLPRIARRLHHSRDLGEPFDFLTWFEFAPEHEPAFDELVRRLRGSEEWRYVDREVEVRLIRDR
jgi:hypothetical protein